MQCDHTHGRAGLTLSPGLRLRTLLPAVRSVALLCLGFVLVNGLVVAWLVLLGHDALPSAVPLEWWNGSLLSHHNSQHVTDVYSPLHAVSGAALYVVATALRPHWPLHRRVLLVIACSGVWEIVENTPPVIALFNAAQGPAVYGGDSVVNALSDSAFVLGGSLAAPGFRRWLVITAGVLVEIARGAGHRRRSGHWHRHARAALNGRRAGMDRGDGQ